MKQTAIAMDMIGNLVMIHVKIWNKKTGKLNPVYLTFDTGASITTLSKDILHQAGYDVLSGNINRITTASGIEFVREVQLDKLALGDIILDDVTTYAHTFPQESFSLGVIGLNVLQHFDIELLFSQRIIRLTQF